MNNSNYDFDDVMRKIRYPEEYGWFVDENRKVAWFARNVADMIDEREILDQSLGKLYAFNLTRYEVGHSQEKPPIQTIRNSRYVWSVWAYIHSGISLTPSYSASYQHYDRWDSGQAGYHIVTLTDIYRWMPKSKWVKMNREEQDKWVKKQVREWYDEYNAWLNGDVYEITLYRLPDDLFTRYQKYGTSVFVPREMVDLGLEEDSLWYFGNQYKEAQQWMDEWLKKIDVESEHNK